MEMLSRLSGDELIASLSGAILFITTQRNFHGMKIILTFIVSFLMGNIGAEITASLVGRLFPDDILVGRDCGAFICSALIVKMSMLIVAYIERRIDNLDGL